MLADDEMEIPPAALASTGEKAIEEARRPKAKTDENRIVVRVRLFFIPILSGIFLKSLCILIEYNSFFWGGKKFFVNIFIFLDARLIGEQGVEYFSYF
jgi:hypothetical protein